jgi:hypothetical protein
LPCLPSLPLKSGWKSPWPQNSCFLHVCKTNIMWTLPRSAASSISVWVLSDHSCSDLWVPGWLTMGKHFLMQSCVNMAPQSSLLKAKSFKWTYNFTNLRLQREESSQILTCPQDIFPIVSMQSTWLLLIDTNIFSNHISLNPDFIFY